LIGGFDDVRQRAYFSANRIVWDDPSGSVEMRAYHRLDAP